MDKVGTHDYWLDVSVTFIAFGVMMTAIHIFRGKFHHWGSKIHGRNVDGSKAEKEEEEEHKKAA
jgi:hypothetical protein